MEKNLSRVGVFLILKFLFFVCISVNNLVIYFHCFTYNCTCIMHSQYTLLTIHDLLINKIQQKQKSKQNKNNLKSLDLYILNYKKQKKQRKYPITMIIRFSILMNLIFVTICFRSVNFTALQISPYNVDYQWEQIQKVLQGQPITQLMFDKVLVCQVGVAKILSSINVVDSLTSLKFNRVFGFNQDVMKAIWQSKPATRLKNLTIDVCNVENKDFAYWPTDKELALENLSLEQNFIGSEGFNLLSKTKMNNLVNLNIYKTSLVDDKSIDSILKLNISKFQKLNIGYTSISSANTLKLLSSLNLSTITTLNISKNNFQQQFYSNFSKYNFNSLQQLDLSQLLIDEDGIKYLKDMKFPSLKRLSIGGNYCFGDGLYTFLKRANYPRLTQLVVDGGVFGDGFFGYFVKEFHQNLFQILVFDGKGISSDIFYHLKTLNLTNLRRLAVLNGFMKPQLINDFMDASQFEQLQKLTLIGLKNTGQLLHKIMDKKWPKLKMLYLGRVGKINMTKLQQQSKTIRFPILEHILINLHGYNSSQICQYLNNTSSTSPRTIRIQLSTAYPFKLIQALLNPQTKFINQILLQISDQKQNQIVFKCMLNPQTQPYIYYFPINHAIQSQYTYMTRSQQYEDNQEYMEFMDIKGKQYQDGFLYDDVEKLEDSGGCRLVAMLRRKFLDLNKQCVFPGVRAIIMQKITDQCYTNLSECKFPNIIQLSISIKNLTCFDPNNTHQFKLFLPHNLSQVIQISLIDERYIPNKKVIQFFKRQKLRFIQSLSIVNSDLKSQQINVIFNTSKGIKRIKILRIVITWIHNVQFINLYDFVLEMLDLSGEMIGNSIQELSGIGFQFMRYLRLAGDGITDQQFREFVDGVKNGSGRNAFPKLTSALFFQNEIQMGGTLKLLQAGAPYLQQVNFLSNKNPGLINQILGSSLHRLTKLLTYRNDDDSIDPNLPQKSSKQIQIISLQSSFLSISDFQSLSRLQFPSLSTLQIQFQKDFNCNMLPPILSLSKNINSLNLQFSQQILEISSQCLQNNQVASDNSIQHLNKLVLTSSNNYYSNLRKLFNWIIFNQEIVVLFIEGVYPQERVLRRLVMLGNWEYLDTLVIRSSGLTDQIVFMLLNRDFREMKILQLSHNHQLTSAAIKSMANRTYPQLQQIILDSTQCNDTTIQILLTCNLPSLTQLSLANTNITGKSMQYLSVLKAPYLRSIDISNNNLKYQDLAKLKVDNFPKLVQIIVYPYKTQKQKSNLQELFNKNRDKDYQIQVKCDVMYYEIINEEDQGINKETI